MQEETHDKLKIRVNSNENPYAAADMEQKQLEPRRLASYFIVLIDSGSVTYQLDLQDITITAGDLLFAMPNQIFVPPAQTGPLQYYKVLFDENTLALLPQRFSFLVNPLHSQTITLESPARERVRKVFEILNQILYTDSHSTDSEITLAYLNLLLSELNNAYFKNEPVATVNTNLSKFVEFKLMVETHLTEQPSINAIAGKLSLTSNSLYRLVKEYSGTSPKDFLTNRLMMEAQRKLRYSNLSVKELAYELGFNDPDYFSRLFKKSTGKSVSDFLNNQDL
ncbi:helix-turn-helix domain-containing protein [Flavobacterium humi]|uniref:AraC family transcriptional regulator n=1 Tax=Flavobacterium humi TaxID=2562683 RepID=A0A4Z0L5S3_9FLAO|nr:AraC family transcriptional regulator [Flavobacterium humi]TGD57866.1 AraC family transcriptional regulator [Flavobacterium humi]